MRIHCPRCNALLGVLAAGRYTIHSTLHGGHAIVARGIESIDCARCGYTWRPDACPAVQSSKGGEPERPAEGACAAGKRET